MIRILPYTFPDAIMLEDNESEYRSLAWIPPFEAVVLGCGSKADTAFEHEAIAQDEIQVFRRPTGGESMFLSPKMTVISILIQMPVQFLAKALFSATGETLIRALTGLGIRGLCLRGTSDLVLGKKKVLGSSIYQRKNRLFYHAVLNVGEEPFRIQKYLRHPEREPDYRNGRSHAEFVTSLNREGFSINPETIRKALEGAFKTKPI